jgi:hypothetical protein
VSRFPRDHVCGSSSNQKRLPPNVSGLAQSYRTQRDGSLWGVSQAINCLATFIESLLDQTGPFCTLLPAKFAPFEMERFANAIMEPAKFAYLFDRCRVGRKLKYKFKGLILRRISRKWRLRPASWHRWCYRQWQDEIYTQMFTTPFNPLVLIVLA